MANPILQDTLCPEGSTLYYALNRLPPGKRSICVGLFGLYTEFHKLVFSTSDTVYVQYGWWYQELERLLSDTPRHPVTIAVSNWEGCDRAQPLQWIENLEPFIRTSTFEDENALLALCANLTEPLFRACNLVCGTTDPEDHTVRNAAAAYTLFGFIQDFGRYVRDGIIPAPRSDLDSMNITSHSLRTSGSPEIERLLQFQCDRAIGLLTPPPGEPSRGPLLTHYYVLIISAIHLATLHQIRRCHYDVVNSRIDITPLRKAWIAWKIFRKH